MARALTNALLLRSILNAPDPAAAYLQHALKRTTQQFCAQYSCTPQGVNEGSCLEFAGAIRAACIGTKMRMQESGPPHCFIEHNGKFYDAECHQGVCDWHELPFFKRLASN